MLLATTSDIEAVRFASPDSLERYMSEPALQRTAVSKSAALEESFFLGLRLTRGISLRELAINFGGEAVDTARTAIAELVEVGLMQQQGDFVRLTDRGRLLSNDVFERFIAVHEIAR
jgi:oxygen-independent coproporphyrinogen-3 oxidase